MKRWYLYPFPWFIILLLPSETECTIGEFFSSTKFKTPMIGVGNLSVGGSGKSPYGNVFGRLSLKF